MFINQIIWDKNQGRHMSNRCMQTHDVLLFYGFDHIFTIQREPYLVKSCGTVNYYKKRYGKQAAQERYELGKEVQDVWKIPLNMVKRDYPTQKPYKLLERLICLGTK